MVNLDAETLRLLDSVAALSRQSRSAVVADVLQAFVPMFQPVALELERLRGQPAKAVKMLHEQAETLHTLTAELVERAKGAAGTVSGGGSAASETGRARPARGIQPPAQ